MKQTLEEAAYDYATNKTKFRKEVLKEVDSDNYVSRKSDCMEDFQCGAEWHAKQSPWIRVEDKDGDFTGWNNPLYKFREVVAIAQNYRDSGYSPDSLDRHPKDLSVRGLMKNSA